MRALFITEFGDLGGFGVCGVVFPQPDVGVKVVSELGKKGEGSAGLVDGDGGGAGRVDTDADDRFGVE